MEATETPTIRLSCAETAKLVRTALKAEFKTKFPATKFGVTSSNYSGGASISVRWTDGPTGEQVEAVTRLYQGATFDGMIDLKTNHTSILVSADGTPQMVSFGADFILHERGFSPEFEAGIIAFLEATLALGTEGNKYEPNARYEDGQCWHQDLFWRIASKTAEGVAPAW